jgi:predicted MPP superfamily phosphohydrolase
MLTRRHFLRAGLGAAGAVAATGLYTWQIEPHWLEMVHRDLPIKGLAPQLAGKTLVQMSDLHIGPQVSDAYLIHTLKRVRALQPDYIVMTGDWVSYRGDQTIAQMKNVLKFLPQGRLGTIGILGNHDYGPTFGNMEVARKVCGTAEDAGVLVLRNEAARVGGLTFVGLDDYWSPRYDPEIVIHRHQDDGGTLVLCHNPDACDSPVWGNYSGWILAGHTHGGQCKPPFLPPPLLPVNNRRYTRGEFALSGDRRLYINSGVGHLIQVRFNVRPEVTVFKLTPA